MILHKSFYDKYFFLLSFVKRIAYFLKYLCFLFRHHSSSKEDFLPIPFLVQDQGNFRCNACGLCEDICPVQCIEVFAVNKNDTPFERKMKKFTLTPHQCIHCHYCERVCPEKAIIMTNPPSEYLFTRKILDEQKLVKNIP